MIGYCLICKKKIEYTVKNKKRMKNGLHIYTGLDKYGHKVSKIDK